MIQNYKNLEVWKKSMSLVIGVYEITSKFPKEEQYGLTSQIRRSAISIPSNIAEGKMRGYEKDFKKFLLIAFGSGAELETQLELAKQLPTMKNLDYTGVDTLLAEIMKMLNSLISKLDASS